MKPAEEAKPAEAGEEKEKDAQAQPASESSAPVDTGTPLFDGAKRGVRTQHVWKASKTEIAEGIFERQLHYQLFIPRDFDASKKAHYSLITFLHGAGDGAFDVANSQSLPRLLGPECWKDFTFRPPDKQNVVLKYDNCTFTEDFKQVVFLPSSGTPSHWHGTMFSTV